MNAPPITGVMLEADRRMVGQILYEVVENAIKFATENSTVTIELIPIEVEQRLVLRFRVHDAGTGLAKDQLAHVLATEGGSALGLSIARKMIELHSGRIWAESEGEGKGASFTVELPAERPAGTHS